ncbi:MAG: hypothetical protein IPH99_09400 [Xanthomonadales bacterium]|nr:hypothetical protein [Xanthomonadales bacterium]
MNLTPPTQQELLLQSDLAAQVESAVLALLADGRQPSAWELLHEVETKVDLTSRWDLVVVMGLIAKTASRVEQMAKEVLKARTKRGPAAGKSA